MMNHTIKSNIPKDVSAEHIVKDTESDDIRDVKFTYSIQSIPEDISKKMLGNSWHSGCPVPLVMGFQ